jgi:cysteine desulfurase / selenocysteine lyase
MASTSPIVSTLSSSDIDVSTLRKDFPTLKQKVHGKPLVYLDNAATAQTPQSVIDSIHQFYTQECSNIHRGVHWLSGQATKAYEQSRAKVQKLLGARQASEILFLRGTTEAVNLVAHSYGEPQVQAGDNIVISGMEHHSNIVPWQILCQRKGAELRVWPVDDCGDLDLNRLPTLLDTRTRLLSITHTSNAIGTINPIKDIVALAHEKNIPVFVDGAQSAPHMPVNVQELDCDFYAFSGHKLYGPMGIGALYVKEDLLKNLIPYQSGGGMISTVSFDDTQYAEGPEKFEAGTPNVVGAIALGAAIDYLLAIGLDTISTHEKSLMRQAEHLLAKVPGLKRIGHPAKHVAVYSMVMESIHPHDLGTILDQEGIAIRAGHHCAQPLMRHFGVPATVRVSFGLYNTCDDIQTLADGIEHAREIFRL